MALSRLSNPTREPLGFRLARSCSKSKPGPIAHGAKGSPMSRHDMRCWHYSSASIVKMVNFSALKCRIWSHGTIAGTVVMQFSHLFLRRTIDFCSAAF
jgi:hypothetical protein